MKKIKKIFNLLLIALTLCCNLSVANAQTLTDNLYQDDNYKWWVAIYKRDGSSMVATQESMLRRTSDNMPIYCIQPHIQFNSGSNVNGIVDTNTMITMSGLSAQQIERIRLIAYYGYGYGNHTDATWYYATQMLIWDTTNPGYTYAIADGDTSLAPSNRYNSYYNEINSLVQNHTVDPSFIGPDKEVKMKAGETIILNDTNGVLSKYYLGYEDEHIKAVVNNDNTLSLTAKTGYEGAIVLNSKDNTNRPMLYEGANQLCMSTGDPDGRAVALKIYATTEVEGTKVYGKDNDGIYRPEKDAKFEIYDNESNELIDTVTTDKNGKFSYNLGYGTYRIHQIDGKKGYEFVKDYLITIDGTTDKEVIYFKNEFIIGSLELIKTDANSGKPLANAKFEIYNEETNELICVKTTGIDGKINIDSLEFGKYYLIEKEAPEGYKVNPEKMFFEISKNGEVVKLNMKDEKQEIVIKVPDTFKAREFKLEIISCILVLTGVGIFVCATKRKK